MFHKTKVMYLCSVGGHLVQILKIAKYINEKNCVFIVNDRLDLDDLMIGNTHQITHATRNWKQIINLFEAIYYIGVYRPKILLSTGASPAVVFSIIAKLTGTRVIFVESLSRVTKPSLTGKLIYRIADEFYIQWPGLKRYFPKAFYYGNLIS